MRFTDRQEAGQRLAHRLKKYRDKQTVIVAVPRGGVPVAAEVAKLLETPLQVILVSKIGHPYEPEYAVGAITEDGQALYDSDALMELGDTWLKQASSTARKRLEKQRAMYGEAAIPEVIGKTVIIIDDGIATGLTMEAAVSAIRTQRPKKIVVAVPVMSPTSLTDLASITDEIITLEKPDKYTGAIGSYYEQFEQVDDDTVCTILDDIASYGY